MEMHDLTWTNVTRMCFVSKWVKLVLVGFDKPRPSIIQTEMEDRVDV